MFRHSSLERRRASSDEGVIVLSFDLADLRRAGVAVAPLPDERGMITRRRYGAPGPYVIRFEQAEPPDPGRGGYIADMAVDPEKRRAEKTTKRLRAGGLQPPAQDVRERDIRILCDGCGEAVTAEDKVYAVRVGGVFDVKLHEACYDAWLFFKP
jgi:hypothetical protein